MERHTETGWDVLSPQVFTQRWVLSLRCSVAGAGAADAVRELVGQTVVCVGQWLGLTGGNVKV